MNPIFCKVYALPRFSEVLPHGEDGCFSTFYGGIRDVRAFRVQKEGGRLFRESHTPCEFYVIK